MWRGLAIARRAPDELGALLAAGMCIWLALEAFINMSVMLNVLPFAGNALPFVSAWWTTCELPMEQSAFC